MPLEPSIGDRAGAVYGRTRTPESVSRPALAGERESGAKMRSDEWVADKAAASDSSREDAWAALAEAEATIQAIAATTRQQAAGPTEPRAATRQRVQALAEGSRSGPSQAHRDLATLRETAGRLQNDASATPAAWRHVTDLAKMITRAVGRPAPTTTDAPSVPLLAPSPKLAPADERLIDDLTRAHFQYFANQSDPTTGLTRDRSTVDSPASVAAVGFSLTAYGVAVHNGEITRAAAAAYALKVLRTLAESPQGPAATGVAGYHGLFYHFIDVKAATRHEACELSTVDTALLMGGVLFARNFFDGDGAQEQEIRELADGLYRQVDWAWALNGGDQLSMGWHPEKGFIESRWAGYNEGMLLLLLGLGSPTHPLPAAAWSAYMRDAKVKEQYGESHVPFGPLFGHQYSHCWVDFRGIQDEASRARGFDWAENSRRATLAQHAYASDNPGNWKGYGPLDWGLTACDGPGDLKFGVSNPDGKFQGYMARGAHGDPDDGTIAPTAAAASLPFAPEIVLPTLRHWREDRPEIWTSEGFSDAFNPSAMQEEPSGWVDSERLGIDQGPIVLMLENFRTGFVWEVMRRDPYIRKGLERAGFTGGWLSTQSSRPLKSVPVRCAIHRSVSGRQTGLRLQPDLLTARK